MTPSSPSAPGRTRQGRVFIDCFPEAAGRYVRGHAIVAVDVIRATTTAVTAAARGRICYPVPSVEAGVLLARELDNPLLVGEVGGNMPYGFDLTNSPAEIDVREDVERPMVLVSSSGTQLVYQSGPSGAVYLACFRNVTATVEALAGRYANVAVIGAGTRGEFRPEDELCCALVAGGLMERGYEAGDERTQQAVERWRDAPHEAWMASRSVEYLRKTDQEKDLEFVRRHIDDIGTAYRLNGIGVVVPHDPASPPAGRWSAPGPMVAGSER